MNVEPQQGQDDSLDAAEASDSADPESSRRRRWLGMGIGCVLVAGLFGAFAYRRYLTFHNSTFDLAFYTRMAWGLTRGDLYDPVVGAHVFGLHLSPVLLPLGALGALLGTVPVLLAAQALSAAGAAWVLGRMGEAHLGPKGRLAGAAVFLLHPNLSHVLGYEFHVGLLAFWPLALLAEALDKRDAEGLVWASLAAIACREDLAMVTFVAGLLLVFDARFGAARETGQAQSWRSSALTAGLSISVGSVAWLLIFVGYLLPHYGPESGSVNAHFGHLGGSLPSALLRCLTDPGAVLAHLMTLERVTYLPRLAGPLLLLPLCSGRAMCLAAPTLVIVLLSQFPTTTKIYSHYFTSALPFFVAGAIWVAGRWQRSSGWKGRLGRQATRLLPVAAAAAYLIAGGGPGSLRAPHARWRTDATTRAGRAVVQRIEELEHTGRLAGRALSIQAPHALMPHLAERPRIYRPVAEIGERRADLWVLDVSHRQRYFLQEGLLRTQQEPLIRDWLTREDRTLVLMTGPFAVFASHARDVLADGEGHGTRPEHLAAPRYCIDRASRPDETRSPLTSCLSLLPGRTARETGMEHLSQTIEQRGWTVSVLAHGPCPPDLALRFAPDHAALICEGTVSPARFREGDVFRVLLPARVAHDGAVRDVDALMAIRSSGAPVSPEDVQQPVRDPGR